MSELKTFNLLDLNDAAEDVYNKHVANKSFSCRKGTDSRSELNKGQVQDVIVLCIFGAKTGEVAKYYDVVPATISTVKGRKAHRKLSIPFQKSKEKRMNRMVFTYDYGLVVEHYNKLPDDLKSLCNKIPDMIQAEDLVVKTKTLKSEFYE